MSSWIIGNKIRVDMFLEKPIKKKKTNWIRKRKGTKIKQSKIHENTMQDPMYVVNM